MTSQPGIAEPYHTERSSGPWDAIVIGSGIGGLSAAALLSRYGDKRVLVLERHYTPGGFTHTFRRPGYEWDVGVHYVGELARGNPIRSVFDAISDGSLGWATLGDVYDRVIIGDTTFDFRVGANNLRGDLIGHFPHEADAVDRYFATVREVTAASAGYFLAKALPAPIGVFAGPLMSRGFMRYARRTTRSVLEEITQDQRLIAVLTGQWGNFGLPPAESSFAIHAIVANHYFDGAYYPVGGASRIFQAIAPVIAASGGKVLINAEVSEIVMANGRVAGVQMKDGAIIRAPLVISDAGVVNTLKRMVPSEIAEKYGGILDDHGLKPSTAHLCLYLGLRHTAEELCLPTNNIWIYPDERHERTYTSNLEDPDASMAPVYVSFPSARDPDFSRRHPGRATIEVLSLARWDTFARWADTRWKKRGDDYEVMKQRLTEKLLSVVYRHLPQVLGKIDFCEMSTPLTTRHFANHRYGEIYGLAHTPTRFCEPLLRPRTQVPGLYLTGQDVTTCGVAGALMGGVLCASAVLRRNLMKVIAKVSPGAGMHRDVTAQVPQRA